MSNYCKDCKYYRAPFWPHPECPREGPYCTFPNLNIVSGAQIDRDCYYQRESPEIGACGPSGRNFVAKAALAKAEGK